MDVDGVTPVTETAAELIPEHASLAELRRIAAGCTACDLHARATQTVFGHGPGSADLLVVGEQPGDEEDREGAPFVGPAGRELDRGLAAVGIDRGAVYVTNTVKHFKWSQQRGKRRLHDKPNRIEIRACLPWLRAELAHVDPTAVLTLGATAAQALLGSGFRVTRERGVVLDGPDGRSLVATVHPSSILRSRGDDARHRAREAFHADLRVVAELLR